MFGKRMKSIKKLDVSPSHLHIDLSSLSLNSDLSVVSPERGEERMGESPNKSVPIFDQAQFGEAKEPMSAGLKQKPLISISSDS